MKSRLLIETSVGVFLATEIAAVIRNAGEVDTATILTTGGAHVVTPDPYEEFVGRLDEVIAEWNGDGPPPQTGETKSLASVITSLNNAVWPQPGFDSEGASRNQTEQPGELPPG